MKARQGFYILTAIVLTLLAVGCGESREVASRDTGSLAGTGDLAADIPVYSSLGEMEEESDLIIIGHCKEAPEKIDEKGILTAVYTVTVDKIVKGLDVGSVKVSRIIDPAVTENETWLKAGQDYFLFLTTSGSRQSVHGIDEDIYCTIGLEQGVFEITGTNHLKAYADIGIASKLDGKKAEALAEDLTGENRPNSSDF